MISKVLVRKPLYETYLKKVPEWRIDVVEKEAVIRFFKEYELGKITGRSPGPSTTEHYVLYLRTALEFMKRHSRLLKVSDIDKFAEAILKDRLKTNRGRPYSESVKVKIRRTLCQWLEWRVPHRAATLTRSLRVKVRHKQPNPDFLSEQEVDRLYKTAKDAAERYLLAMLFASGARLSEFLNIRRSDIALPKAQENFVKVTLREEFSKTKGRTISLYYKHALEAVRDYLEERIQTGLLPDEPVWHGSFSGTAKKLQRLGQKALGKRLHFHVFRSSCATWIANRLNRQELCYFFGWRFSSPMPDIYIARAGIEMNKVDVKMAGTEMGELKASLSHMEHENKMKDERIARLEKAIQTIEQGFPVIAKLVEMAPSRTVLNAAISRKRAA